MKNYTYVYILQSKKHPQKHYTGMTGNLEDRLNKHNAGDVPHTSKYSPWKLKTAIAFDSRQRAADFEKYLKSHSGRVFSSRHF